MSGADGQAQAVCGADGGHGRNFSGGALRVGQVALADFFADGHDDTFPAHHGAESEGQCHGYLHPQGDEAGRPVNVAFVILQNRRIRGGDPVRTLQLDSDLRDVVVKGDHLLVTRFRSAELLELDASGFGMGTRGQRFAIVVRDGVATRIEVEQPGQFKVSAAEAILSQL